MKSVDNSSAVQVSFNLSAEAALLLSRLAHLGSPGLAQIGVTSVSIDDADAIPLKINNVRDNNAAEPTRSKTVANNDERHSNCSAQPSPRILSSLRNNIMQLLGSVATSKIENVPVLSTDRNTQLQLQPVEIVSHINTVETMDISKLNASKSDRIKTISMIPKFVEEQDLEFDDKKYNRPWQSSAELKEAESDLRQLDTKNVRFSQDGMTIPGQQSSNGLLSSPPACSTPKLIHDSSINTHTSLTSVSRSSPNLTLDINSDVNYLKNIVHSDERKPDKPKIMIETIEVPPASYLPIEPDDLKRIRRRSVKQDLSENARPLPDSIRPNRLSPVSSTIDAIRRESLERTVRSDEISAISLPRDNMPSNHLISQNSLPDNYSPTSKPRIFLPGNNAPNIQSIPRQSLPDSYSSIPMSRESIGPMQSISRQSLRDNYSPITMSMDEILKASPRSHHLNRHIEPAASYSLPMEIFFSIPPIPNNSLKLDDLMPITGTRSVDGMWKVPPVSHQPYLSSDASPMKLSMNNMWKIPPISQSQSRPVSWSPSTMEEDNVPYTSSRQPIQRAERQPIGHQNELFEVPISPSLRVPKKKRRKQDTDIPRGSDTNTHHALLSGSNIDNSFNSAMDRYSPDACGAFNPPTLFSPDLYHPREPFPGHLGDRYIHKLNISEKSHAVPSDMMRSTPNERHASMNYERGRREFISDERDQFRESLSYSGSNAREISLPRETSTCNYESGSHGPLSIAFTPPGSPLISPNSGGTSNSRNIKEFKEISLLKSVPYQPYNDSLAIAEPERIDIQRHLEPSGKSIQKPKLVARDKYETVSLETHKNPPVQCSPLGGIFKGMFDDLHRLEQQSTSINSFNSVSFLSGSDAKSYPQHGNYDVAAHRPNSASGSYDVPKSLYDVPPRPGASPFDLPTFNDSPFFDLRRPFNPETHDLKRPFDPASFDIKKLLDPAPPGDRKRTSDPAPYEFSLGNWVSSHSPSVGNITVPTGSQIYQPWQESGTNKIHVKLKQLEPSRSINDDHDEAMQHAPDLEGRAKTSSDCVVPKKRLRLRDFSKDEQNCDAERFVDETVPKDHLRNEFVEKTSNKSEEQHCAGSVLANLQSARELPASTDSSKMHLKKIRLVRWNNSSEENADERIYAPIAHYSSTRPVLWNRSDKNRNNEGSPDDKTRINPSTSLSTEPTDSPVNARDTQLENSGQFVQSVSVRRLDNDYSVPMTASIVSDQGSSAKASFSHQPEIIKLMLKEDLDNESSGGIVSKKHRAIRYFLARRSSSVEETPEGGFTEGGGTGDKSVHSPILSHLPNLFQSSVPSLLPDLSHLHVLSHSPDPSHQSGTSHSSDPSLLPAPSHSPVTSHSLIPSHIPVMSHLLNPSHSDVPSHSPITCHSPDLSHSNIDMISALVRDSSSDIRGQGDSLPLDMIPGNTQESDHSRTLIRSGDSSIQGIDDPKSSSSDKLLDRLDGEPLRGSNTAAVVQDELVGRPSVPHEGAEDSSEH